MNRCTRSKGRSFLYSTSIVVASTGAISLSLFGIAGFNLVEYLLESIPAVKQIFYAMIGVGGVVTLWKYCSCCIKDNE